MFIRSLIASCAAVLLVCTLALAHGPTHVQKEYSWQDMLKIVNFCLDKDEATCLEMEELKRAIGEEQRDILSVKMFQSCLRLTLDDPPESLKVTGTMDKATAESIKQYAEEANISVNNNKGFFFLLGTLFKDCEARLE